MQKVIAGLFALVFMTIASVAYAADSNIEFGVTDDLTVQGEEGALGDADVEIKGFTTFGTVGTSTNIVVEAGAIWLEGGIEASAYSYFGSSINVQSYGKFVGSVTAGGLDISGWANFTSTVTISEGQLIIDGGIPGQVLMYNSAGTYWGSLGGTLGGGTQDYIPYWNTGAGDSLGNSVLFQSGSPANMLTVKGSSLTVEAELFVMFGSTITGALQAVGGIYVNSDKFTVNAADGNTAIAGTLDVSGQADLDGGIDVNTGQFTVDTAGNTAFSGTLAVTGANATTLSGTLTVDSTSLFKSSATVIGNLGVGSNVLYSADIALNVKAIDTDDGLRVEAADTADYIAEFYSGTDLAAWIKEK